MTDPSKLSLEDLFGPGAEAIASLNRAKREAADSFKPQAVCTFILEQTCTTCHSSFEAPRFAHNSSFIRGATPKGQEYLKRLEAIAVMTEGEDRTKAFVALRSEALLANPLLDFDKLLLIRRKAGNLGMPANWCSNSSRVTTTA